MLRPQIKPRLPRNLAFPLKALELAPFVLEETRGFPVELQFSDSPTGSKSKFASLLRTRTPYAVVRVMFTRWEKALSIGDHFERQLAGYWSVTIYPVPAAFNAIARAMLLTEGLHAVSSWMGQRRRASWFYGCRTYDVILDPWNGRISFTEDPVAV